MSQETPLLRVLNVSKWFGGLRALAHVDLEVYPGEVHGLIGPNGSGKTTLFNIISGLYRPDGGSVELEGRTISGASPHEVTKRGLARTFQNILLFRQMTVLENVMVGCHCRTHAEIVGAFTRSARVKAEEKLIREKSYEILRFVGLTDRANDLASTLPYGQQRILEIARALAIEPKLIMLDEPVAGLTSGEASEVIGLLDHVRDQGYTILIIEHNMDVVMNVCDRITVLNRGIKIATGTPSEIKSNSAVIDAYLGTPQLSFIRKRKMRTGTLNATEMGEAGPEINTDEGGNSHA